MNSWKKDCQSSNKKSGKAKTSLTSRQKKLLKQGDFGSFIQVLNEVHNSNLVTSVGDVNVKTH